MTLLDLIRTPASRLAATLLLFLLFLLFHPTTRTRTVARIATVAVAKPGREARQSGHSLSVSAEQGNRRYRRGARGGSGLPRRSCRVFRDHRRGQGCDRNAATAPPSLRPAMVAGRLLATPIVGTSPLLSTHCRSQPIKKAFGSLLRRDISSVRIGFVRRSSADGRSRGCLASTLLRRWSDLSSGA